VAQLAALKTAPTPALKARWRELFDTEPPPYNRKFLESRLAYRIQELAYGGLSEATGLQLAFVEDMEHPDSDCVLDHVAQLVARRDEYSDDDSRELVPARSSGSGRSGNNWRRAARSLACGATESRSAARG
jgi:hypothetical protein